MDASERYSTSLASFLPSDTCSPGVNAGVINQDFRLARTLSGPLGGAMISSCQQRLHMEKTIPLSNGWNSVDHGNLGLTVDPSKGGFSLQGVGLPASQSIARFTSNPGFAERAARFSAFGNGHYSQSFPLTENGNLVRPGGQSFDTDTKHANLSSRGQIPSGAKGPAEASGRSSHVNVLEGEIERTSMEDMSAKVDAKASVSRMHGSPSRSGAERDEGCNLYETDGGAQVGSPESNATDASKGQETSCQDGDRDRSAATHISGKKRKSSADEPVKEAASPAAKDQKNTSAQSKRSKGGEGTVEKDEHKSKAERSDNSSSSSQAVKESSKVVDHPKTDYIHVRARRGQATDSHSLAERVRREKISERMKFLQDLVPGCSKVTGKAVMLDEIINYVQSIQRQVEFLSMKLAAVTPRPEFNIDSFLTKQLQMGQGCGLPNMVEHPETTMSFPQLHSHQGMHMQHGITSGLELQPSLDSTLRRMNSAPLPVPRAPVESFGDQLSQVSGLWDGELQSVVQMGYNQGRPMMGLGGLQCDLPPGHMKIEL